MTIRPTTTEYEDNDISIDHTTLPHTTINSINYTRDASIVDIEELEENEQILEQIPKFKTKRRYSLLPKITAFKTGSPGLEEYYNQQKLDPKFDAILKPSVLLDESLIKYNHAFDEFLRSNPILKMNHPDLFMIQIKH